MNKHRAHHYWRYTRQFRWQYLLAAAGIATIVCALALRGNYQTMVEKRQAVYAADRSNGDVKAALSDLQSYVTGHMNTDLATPQSPYPPIQLQYTYQRLVEQQSGRLNAGNQGLYTEAEKFCEAQNPTGFSGRYRIDCITKYIQDRGVATVATSSIPDSLYKFSFASPWWSPDLAGLSMLAAVVLFLMATFQFVTERWFRSHK